MDRGYHCLIDMDMVAVPSLDIASVANPLELLFEQESARFARSKIIKQKSDWPPRSILLSKLVYLEVEPKNIPRLILKLLGANMVKLEKSSGNVIENSIFGVWKKPSVSQRPIRTGNRSNLLFNEDLSAAKLPLPDIVNSLFLQEWEKLRVAACDIFQYYNRLKEPAEPIPFLGMPKINAELLGLPDLSGSLTPCLTCIPMGAKFSVALA